MVDAPMRIIFSSSSLQLRIRLSRRFTMLQAHSYSSCPRGVTSTDFVVRTIRLV